VGWNLHLADIVTDLGCGDFPPEPAPLLTIRVPDRFHQQLASQTPLASWDPCIVQMVLTYLTAWLDHCVLFYSSEHSALFALEVAPGTDPTTPSPT
jgi:hypothetical protein